MQEFDPPNVDRRDVIHNLCGGNARAKILATLLTNDEQWFRVTELAEEAGVSRRTVYREMGVLKGYRLLEIEEDDDGATLYKMKISHPVAEKLRELAIVGQGFIEDLVDDSDHAPEIAE